MARAFRCLALAVAALAAAPALAAADATVALDTTTAVLTITADAGPDVITVQQNGATHVVSRTGGGLTAAGVCTAGPGTSVSCTGAAMLAVDLAAGNDRYTSATVTVPQSIAGGADDDTIRGGGGGDVLAGGSGDDLDGLGGIDEYFGETGADTLNARDGNAERVACGPDADSVTNDFTDIIADCEQGVDVDRDGVEASADCNDANPGDPPGRAGDFRQRRRRGLQRPRRRQP